MNKQIDTTSVVTSRYSAAAKSVEPALCCPVDYDARYLKAIPQEVIDRDYGCGDPSKYVREGETVLDLGSGGGKICFIASQVVGKTGRVIGVDMNDEMLGLARSSKSIVAERIGYDNVDFYKGRIEDLGVDRDRINAHLQTNPVIDESSLRELESFIAKERSQSPMIADASIDVVVSNCVLNLVDSSEKPKLFAEIFRVLREGGRAVISDIVSDQEVPKHLQDDPTLWSGCVSGALTDGAFVQAFIDAGFHGIQIVSFGEKPWRVVEGIEFRSATLIAYKGKAESGEYAVCRDKVIYRGPFASIRDDFGDEYIRGEITAVFPATFKLLAREPYAKHFVCLPAIRKKKGIALPVTEITGCDSTCDSGGDTQSSCC